MRKIVWSWPLLLVAVAGCLIVYSGFAFSKYGNDSPFLFIISLVLGIVGTFLYSRVREKKEGPIKLVVRKKKDEWIINNN